MLQQTILFVTPHGGVVISTRMSLAEILNRWALYPNSKNVTTGIDDSHDVTSRV